MSSPDRPLPFVNAALLCRDASKGPAGQYSITDILNDIGITLFDAPPGAVIGASFTCCLFVRLTAPPIGKVVVDVAHVAPNGTKRQWNAIEIVFTEKRRGQDFVMKPCELVLDCSGLHRIVFSVGGRTLTEIGAVVTLKAEPRTKSKYGGH
jgi:hypothetical protein